VSLCDGLITVVFSVCLCGQETDASLAVDLHRGVVLAGGITAWSEIKKELTEKNDCKLFE